MNRYFENKEDDFENISNSIDELVELGEYDLNDEVIEKKSVYWGYWGYIVGIKPHYLNTQKNFPP